MNGAIGIEEVTLTDDMIRELCRAVTRDEAGRHFSTWMRYAIELEAAGLIDIHRPIHESGIAYGAEEHNVEITARGMDLIDSRPDLHPK